MFRVDDPSAVSIMPTPEAAGSEAYFTEGSPGVTPATLVRASFLNMVQEELRSVVVAGGITPAKGVNNQLLAAINALIASPGVANFQSSKATSGYQKLPSGLIIQWGAITQSDIANATTAYVWNFPIAFPNSALFGSICPGNNITWSSGAVWCSAEYWSATTMNGFTSSGSTIARTYRVFAIGY